MREEQEKGGVKSPHEKNVVWATQIVSGLSSAPPARVKGPNSKNRRVGPADILAHLWFAVRRRHSSRRWVWLSSHNAGEMSVRCRMRCDYFVKVRVRHFGSDFRWSDENEPRITRPFLRYPLHRIRRDLRQGARFGGHEVKLHLSGWKKRTIINSSFPLTS